MNTPDPIRDAREGVELWRDGPSRVRCATCDRTYAHVHDVSNDPLVQTWQRTGRVVNIVRPWFPQSELFRAAQELLRADGDRSAAVWSLYTSYPELRLSECEALLRQAACEQVSQ